MKSHRLASLVVVAAALAAAAGCRTAGVGDVARREPPPVRQAETAAVLLAAHNRNAGRVQTVEAKPSIRVANRRTTGAVGGKLALERPRNFKLVLSGPIHDVADIGSNDDEFWFWVKDSDEKAVYFCNYDESGASPLAGSLQPDWIVEAMGLRVVPEDELARVKVTAGKDPGTLVLTQTQKDPQGATVFKEMVLSEATHRIREHRVFAADHKTLLAQAVVKEYRVYPVAAAAPGAAPETVYLPGVIHLEWFQEKMALDVTMSGVKVNSKFDDDRRSKLFVEPEMKGFARRNLAERAGIAGGPTSVRESMPAPPPRVPVRLEGPAPIGVDGALRTPRDPAALAADLPPTRSRGVDRVVVPAVPTVADPLPEDVQARTGWRRNSLAPGIER